MKYFRASLIFALLTGVAALDYTFGLSPISPLAAASIEVASQGPVELVTPGNGLTMAKVEEEFGQPIEKLDAVGEPPITRWRYANFTVYFEHDRVIHAVKHRA